MGIEVFGVQPRRGVLQPAVPPIEVLRCQECGGWFLPDESNFGCPGCAEQKELQDAQGNQSRQG